MKELLDQYLPYLATISDNHYIQAGVVVAIFLSLAKMVDLIISRILAGWAKKTKTGIDNQIVDIIHKPLFFTVLLLGLSIVLLLLEIPPEASWVILAIIKSIAVMLWGHFLLKLARVILRRISHSQDQKRLVRTQTLPLFENLAWILIVAMAAYLVLSSWNIDMTAWFASAGIAGLAIGFAAKDTLANLFSGVFIMADAPYKIGDFIVLDSGERGRITHIGIRSTRLLTLDDIEVTIPNSIMGNSKITNESGGPYSKHRIRVKIGVAYGSDIDLVREVMMEVANSNRELLCTQPEPRVRFRNFGDSSLDFELLCWIEHAAHRGKVLDTLNTSVYKHFTESGIEIPFPQQDIHIKEIPSN